MNGTAIFFYDWILTFILNGQYSLQSSEYRYHDMNLPLDNHIPYNIITFQP